MSRQPRQISQTGLYHIIIRGINRKNIFEEEADYLKFLDILGEVKEKEGFQLIAYCLMTNHVHIFLKENEPGNVKQIMHRLLTKYAGWYNRKYERSGSLIGNRYKSEPVEDKKYFFALLRYIHQNPIRSGIVENIEDYKWSSFREYINDGSEISRSQIPGIQASGVRLTDAHLVLSRLCGDEKRARTMIIEFHQHLETEDFGLGDNKKPTDQQVRRKIIQLLDGEEPHAIGKMPKENRTDILRYLHEKEKVSLRQLERITGISRGIIARALKGKSRPQ